MTNQSTKFGSNALTHLLARMNEEGNFPIAVITDRHGFPLASAANAEEDPDIQSAVVALIQKTAIQAQSQLGMAPTDEISIYDAEGRRLVCRPFDVNRHTLILAVLVPDKRQSYRRLTNRVIRNVRRQWRL
ncbi:MAG: hypothetical protein D6796_00835 [Caldilineae bacterium]|nr:MAG: hypothetical protein D6796_00835 [Caldilineae bacterium]